MDHALDEALAKLHGYSYDLRNGLTNHAPMVAEAMHHLGLDAHIQPWVERELSNCKLRPRRVADIDPVNWRTVLGDPARFSDWAGLFADALASDDWQYVIQQWVPRLAPGFSSAAAHGAIRTGHAVRAIAASDNQPRRLELADALASWACEYSALPVSEGPELSLTPSSALAAVNLVDSSEHSPAGSITDALAALQSYPAFAAHYYALDVNDDIHELMLDIASTFARLFHQSVQTPLDAIVFTHAITGMTATRQLLPFLDHSQAILLIRHAFHTGCALHSVYSAHPYTPPLDEPFAPEAEEAVYDALAHGDEHVIKLTDACVSLDAATGDSFFLAAAERCRQLLPPRSV